MVSLSESRLAALIASRSVHRVGEQKPLSVSAGEVTTKVVYLSVHAGPAAAAVLPARSVPVPAPIENPTSPEPAILVSVTVRVLPLPLTPPTIAVAVPVVFSVIVAVESVTGPIFGSV